ncbi:DUF882 domain-containing protein [Xanthobacteraceae bacterium Astr-EGSB]|uniref:DUF882 domain-containing protein n=1 Tax=Astrobacterium formosum TaxID=3069710 RepID=UPI0027B50996|nr:DUF882 domain-containing protein [Xanthobacteraceae bacterium Astr-EGSB]
MLFVSARSPLWITEFPRLARCLGLARCAGLAAVALLLGGQSLQNAAANGDTRTISFRHIHTGETATITYKREGRYDNAGLKQINHIMRDWRRDEEVRMDPRVIDIIWEVNREVDGRSAIEIICGYRAPATNQMLRKRSRGVAQFSQHTLGRAVDFHIPGVPLEAVRNAGLRLQRGGVGFYPSSKFVHLDVGSVRHWPRMTYDQLARVFPDGRTVHVPTNGKPLAGYALALADVRKRGGSPSQLALAAADGAGAEAIETTQKPKKSLLAALFGGGKDEDEDNELATAATQAPSPAAAPRVKTVAVPLPTARPAALIAANDAKPDTKTDAKPARAITLAAAESRPIDLSPPATAPAVDNVFTARGLWEGPQGRPEPPAAIPNPGPVQVADASDVPALGPARMRVEQRPSDLEITSKLAPWPGQQRGNDRVPAEVALAYAAQNDGLIATATPRAAPMGSALTRAGAADAPVDGEGLTTIIKKTISRAASPRAVAAIPGPTSAAPKRTPAPLAGEIYADPWLRALVLAPDLQNYLTATAFEAPDPMSLRPLMVKPDSVVVMTFCNDPHLGMISERFTGSAVVFVSTVTVIGRTAMLR